MAYEHRRFGADHLRGRAGAGCLAGLGRRLPPEEHLPRHRTEPRGADGYKDFLIQRRVAEDDHRSVCSFYLVPADGQPLPAYRPGQYLTFRLPIADPITGQPKAVVRCYSLSDRPRPDYYRVTIKRVPPAAGAPNAPPGLASNFFHDQVQPGVRLSVRPPSGHFFLIEDSPLPIVLVAGGIGITPMLSIVNTILESASSREVWLFFGVRSGAEHIMKGHLDALQKAHANFHLHVSSQIISPLNSQAFSRCAWPDFPR